MNNLITVEHCSKTYGSTHALKDINLTVVPGSIVGILGHNGAGKTTLLKCLMGLTPFEGYVRVLERDPFVQRQALMEDISFISDTATLPHWMRVKDAVFFMDKLHPLFNRQVAEEFLAQSSLSSTARVSQLSKGMLVQLHLALVMAVNSKVLILDEPTLGLDVMYRQIFYTRLIENYFDDNKTILISSHHLDEIEHLLTHAVILREGQLMHSGSMEELGAHWHAVVSPSELPALPPGARVIKPQGLGGAGVVFPQRPEGMTQGRSAQLSEVFLAYSQASEVV